MKSRRGSLSVVGAVLSVALASGLIVFERQESFAVLTWTPEYLSDGGAVPLQAGYFESLLVSELTTRPERADQGVLVDFGPWVVMAAGDYLKVVEVGSQNQPRQTIAGPFLCPKPCNVQVRRSTDGTTISWSQQGGQIGSVRSKYWNPKVETFGAEEMTIENEVRVIGQTVTLSYEDSPLRLSLLLLTLLGLAVSLLVLPKSPSRSV